MELFLIPASESLVGRTQATCMREQLDSENSSVKRVEGNITKYLREGMGAEACIE